jgi:chromate transport protein ChrA
MPRTGSPWEVLRVFFKLGLTSFGGPIAHIGCYREEIVVRRRWIDDTAYTDLVALCQFLPGPASSQVRFSLGLIRAAIREVLRHGPASHCRLPSCSQRSPMAPAHWAVQLAWVLSMD